ncbi:SDR family NAD(P)-dependent oxidoreductase [Streptomyces nigrescens]
MSEQTIALVTGANKGIGYEIAAGLGALGWRVGVGARDEERREGAVAKLRAAGVDAFGVPLDVTEDASVTAAAGLIEDGAARLDVLINNAGVTGSAPQIPTSVDVATVRAAVETNVLGVIRVTNAMLPLLRRSASPRIVNMSSSSSPNPAATPSSRARVTRPSADSLRNSAGFPRADPARDGPARTSRGCPGGAGLRARAGPWHVPPVQSAWSWGRSGRVSKCPREGASFMRALPLGWRGTEGQLVQVVPGAGRTRSVR